MSAALDGSPDQVLAGATALGAQAELARRLGERWATRASGLPGAWSGAASLTATARSAQLAGALRAGGDDLARLEQMGRRYGTQLASVQDTVRVLLVRRGESERELHLLLRPPLPDPDPVEDVRRRHRIQQLREAIQRVQAELREQEDLIERARRVLADALDTPPPRVLSDLRSLFDVGRQVPRLVKGAVMLAQGTVGTFHSIRAVLSRSVDIALEHAGRAFSWVGRILPSAPTIRGVVSWVRTPLLAVVDSVKGLIDGGGYDGIRGVVHRTLSGGGLLGAIGVGVGLVVGAPAAVTLGAAAVGGFTVWQVGNTIWDHRGAVVDVARRAWRGGRRIVRRLLGRGAPRLRELARAVQRMAARPVPPPVRDDGFAPPSVRRPRCENPLPIPLLKPVRAIECEWGPWRRPIKPPPLWSWPWLGVLRVPLLPLVPILLRESGR